MFSSGLDFTEPVSIAAFAAVGRLLRALLCAAGVAFLVVTLRYGVYEHFHGGGRSLSAIVDAIQQ
jgi:hypothetical protein